MGIDGRGSWIRTNGWRDQNPLPYHLAIPLMRQNFNIFAVLCQGKLTLLLQNHVLSFLRKWQGRLDSNQRMARSKPAALPLGDAPNLMTVRWQGRLDSNQRMARSKPAALPLGDAPNLMTVKWQGRLDSNQRMARSKPAALPLGDAPTTVHLQVKNGRGSWIRTNGWRDQNPLPYHLAIPLTNLKMT